MVTIFSGIGRSFHHFQTFLPTPRSAAAFIYPLLIPTATFTISFKLEADFAEFKKRARVLIDYDIPFPITAKVAQVKTVIFSRGCRKCNLWHIRTRSFFGG